VSNSFASHIRQRRERLKRNDPTFSVRQVAARIGVEPSFLSKVERGEAPDVLLALAGKVSTDLKESIRKRPELFASLIRATKDLPDGAVLRIVREVRDGNW
jgi:HTH-type transcriptional regulator, competence development regulator